MLECLCSVEISAADKVSYQTVKILIHWLLALSDTPGNTSREGKNFINFVPTIFAQEWKLSCLDSFVFLQHCALWSFFCPLYSYREWFLLSLSFWYDIFSCSFCFLLCPNPFHAQHFLFDVHQWYSRRTLLLFNHTTMELPIVKN